MNDIKMKTNETKSKRMKMMRALVDEKVSRREYHHYVWAWEKMCNALKATYMEKEK